MRQLGIRILKRGIVVALVLAVLGYLAAEVWIVLAQMNNASIGVSEARFRLESAVRWAAFGVILLIFFELIAFALRRKKPPAPEPPKQP